LQSTDNIIYSLICSKDKISLIFPSFICRARNAHACVCVYTFVGVSSGRYVITYVSLWGYFVGGRIRCIGPSFMGNEWRRSLF